VSGWAWTYCYGVVVLDVEVVVVVEVESVIVAVIFVGHARSLVATRQVAWLACCFATEFVEG
jgi:hypothetical protein